MWTCAHGANAGFHNYRKTKAQYLIGGLELPAVSDKAAREGNFYRASDKENDFFLLREIIFRRQNAQTAV